ncbi:helix-turn-helix domain-containing protein [Roseovarius sp. MBR-51]
MAHACDHQQRVGSRRVGKCVGIPVGTARDLLSRGGLTNAEIAHRVGYGSAGAFVMAFVRHEGTSPGVFAERHGNAQRDEDV